MADFQPIIIRAPDSFVFHTVNPLSNPSIQRSKLIHVSRKLPVEVIDRSTNYLVELFYHRSVQVMISCGTSSGSSLRRPEERPRIPGSSSAPDSMFRTASLLLRKLTKYSRDLAVPDRLVRQPIDEIDPEGNSAIWIMSKTLNPKITDTDTPVYSGHRFLFRIGGILF
jgi:hypothetical protein